MKIDLAYYLENFSPLRNLKEEGSERDKLAQKSV